MKMISIPCCGMVLAAALAGCSVTEHDAAAADADVTIENCGHDIHVDGPPERAVTLEQNATEILVALGVGDRMAGQGYQVDEPLPELAHDYEDIPVLNSASISAEQLRAALPDFTYSTLGSFYSDAGVGTVEELRRLGVPSYVSETNCPGTSSVPASFERLFDEYRDLGEIFGAEAAAAQLVAEQQQILDDASRDSDNPPTVAWFYSTYNGVPIVAGAGGMPSAISEAVGLRNAFDDVTTSSWPEMSWEQIAKRDPDVIVVADLSSRGRPGDSAEEKIELLRSDPVAWNLSAVRTDRIVALSGTAMDPSIRSAAAVSELDHWLTNTESFE
ncbi:MAG: ABC transporter substrate-binding protein [Rhodococcus sp.]|nr:ABC transporter substrate-binding protein [Rhodococcus sp. (in: high G+C Gram-positive bacteria)]